MKKHRKKNAHFTRAGFVAFAILCFPSALFAIQSQTGLPSQFYGSKSATQSPARYSPLERSSTRETSTAVAVDDTSWFGTVMRFPATRRASYKMSAADERNNSDATDSRLLTSQIVVHPPKHTGPNQFSFIIANTGEHPIAPFRVELKTPAGVSILQIAPLNARITSNRASVRIDELSAGQQVMIHVLTTAAKVGSFEFTTQVQSQVAQSFHVQTVPSNEMVDDGAASPFRLAATGLSDSGRSIAAFPRATESDTDRQNASGLANSNESTNDSRRSVLTSNMILTTSLAGAEVLRFDQDEAFVVEIKNPSNQMASDIIVQLVLPAGLLVSALDREAWIDAEKHTVSWKVDSIPSGQKVSIGYQVKATQKGVKHQRVTVGMNNKYQGSVDMRSRVASVDDPVAITYQILEN